MVRLREADPRNPKTALVAFLLVLATLLTLILLQFAVTTGHGRPWWDTKAG
jgi:hypothetical protein